MSPLFPWQISGLTLGKHGGGGRQPSCLTCLMGLKILVLGELFDTWTVKGRQQSLLLGLHTRARAEEWWLGSLSHG